MKLKFFIDTPKKVYNEEYKTPDGKVKLPYVPKERSMKNIINIIKNQKI